MGEDALQGGVVPPRGLQPEEQAAQPGLRARRPTRVGSCHARQPHRREEGAELGGVDGVGAEQGGSQRQGGGVGGRVAGAEPLRAVQLHREVPPPGGTPALLEVEVIEDDYAGRQVVDEEVAVVGDDGAAPVTGERCEVFVCLRVARCVRHAGVVKCREERVAGEEGEETAATRPPRAAPAPDRPRHLHPVGGATQHRRQLPVADVVPAVKHDYRRHVAPL